MDCESDWGNPDTSDVQLLMNKGRVQVTDDPSDSFPLCWRREPDVQQVLWRAGCLGQRCRELFKRLVA